MQLANSSGHISFGLLFPARTSGRGSRVGFSWLPPLLFIG